jgi:hypothetical protein
MPCQDISYGLRRWNCIILVFWSLDRGYEPRRYNTLLIPSGIFCFSRALACTPYATQSTQIALSGRSEWQRQGRTLRLWDPKGHSCSGVRVA